MSQIGNPRRIITVEPVFEPIPQRSKPDVENPKSIPERVEEPETVPARS